jgi:hypothetical protein
VAKNRADFSVWLAILARPLGPTEWSNRLRERENRSYKALDGVVPGTLDQMRPGRPRIDIDESLLGSGTATGIARRLGISVDTVLARQREAGIPVRPQGRRDWPQPPEQLEGVPSWMNADPIIATRSRWA